MPELGDRLCDVEPPQAAQARERSWAVTAAAFAQRPGRRRARVVRPALALALAVLVIGCAVSAPGDAVADWVRDIVTVRETAPRAPAPSRVAGAPAGKLLLAGGGRLRLVQRDGSERFLGTYADGTWSPRGRYVAAWAGRELAALGPGGRRAWSLRAPAPVRAARWSPEGFHVAYLAGRELRVVAGSGVRDRRVAARVRPVTPAFRPGARRTLAWVGANGRVVVADLFTGGVRARSGPYLGRHARMLAWSGDGRTLAVVSGTLVRRWEVAEHHVRTIRLDGTVEALVGAPRGRRFALLLRDRRRATSEVALVDRRPVTVLRLSGRLRDVAFAPDGRRILATWPAARRWLSLDPVRRAVASISPSVGRAARIAGWCCPRRDLPPPP